MRFENKTVLVTGGARGIGAATARRFASEGATVVVADFDEAGAQETANEIGGVGVRCDVTSRADVDAAVATAVERGGSLDVLVTCAGIIRDNLLFRMSEDDWNSVIQTNLTSCFHWTKHLARPMTRSRWGRIVNIASVSGIMGNAGQANYSAAKAGMIGFQPSRTCFVGTRIEFAMYSSLALMVMLLPFSSRTTRS